MTTSTILLIILSLIVAFSVSFYQYLYKAKSRSKVTFLLAFLRFLSIFCLLVLLINPIVSRKTYEVVKTPLPIVIDNSKSIIDLNAKESSLSIFNKLISNKNLKEKYDIHTLRFDKDIMSSDEFKFDGNLTNIDVVANYLKEIYKNQNYPTVLVSDGNQTSGEDYVYSFSGENKIYPIVVGDTTEHLDLKISQLNVNKYAFHKNKFPVEVFLQYSGSKNVNANFKISHKNSIINEQTVSFSPSKKNVTLNLLLPASQIGMQIFKASISSKENEKNTYNNIKNFAVDIIDQRTEVAIVSSINHPDIGALKRSIESNSQRKVTILNTLNISELNRFQVVILYQPNSEFKNIYEINKNLKINTWTITGNSTDFNFLNQVQNNFSFKMSSQKEDYLANFDNQFNLFAIENIGFEQFPPLENPFGTIKVNDNIYSVLSSRVRNIPTNLPLMSFVENDRSRSCYLFGENIWKWRAQSFVNKKTFEEFDVFVDKSIQYLATNNLKKSLVVNHEQFYNSGESIEILAQFFNKNYEFDEKAKLTISVKNTVNAKIKTYDFLKTTNSYKVNLDGINPGNYTFTVKELNSNSSYSGSFEVLDFDIEKQFVNPNWKKLKQLANQTNGELIYPDKVDELVNKLIKDEQYKPVQKSVVKKSPLIEWIWLLVFVSVLLASEWLIRKYHGLL